MSLLQGNDLYLDHNNGLTGLVGKHPEDLRDLLGLDWVVCPVEEKAGAEAVGPLASGTLLLACAHLGYLWTFLPLLGSWSQHPPPPLLPCLGGEPSCACQRSVLSPLYNCCSVTSDG